MKTFKRHKSASKSAFRLTFGTNLRVLQRPETAITFVCVCACVCVCARVRACVRTWAYMHLQSHEKNIEDIYSGLLKFFGKDIERK